MVYLIYDSEEKVTARIQQANNILLPTITDGITNNYADFIKHAKEDLWALVIEPAYEYLFTEEELNTAQKLTEDWFDFEILS
jgi:hypothetical protein